MEIGLGEGFPSLSLLPSSQEPSSRPFSCDTAMEQLNNFVLLPRSLAGSQFPSYTYNFLFLITLWSLKCLSWFSSLLCHFNFLFHILALPCGGWCWNKTYGATRTRKFLHPSSVSVSSMLPDTEEVWINNFHTLSASKCAYMKHVNGLLNHN